jgi:hypothetical protein
MENASDTESGFRTPTVRSNQLRARRKSAASDVATRYAGVKSPVGDPGYRRRLCPAQPRGESPPTRGRTSPAIVRMPVTAPKAIAILGRGLGYCPAFQREGFGAEHAGDGSKRRSGDGSFGFRNETHGHPVGKPLCRPVGRWPRQGVPRRTVCRSGQVTLPYPAERTEAGPGRKQVA